MFLTRSVLVGASMVCAGSALLSLGARSLAAQESRTLRVPRVSRAPRLEDFLEGRAREAEARASGFRQYAPSDGAPASQATEAYLSYDDKNLYVLFVCRDDPEQVRARLTRRDDYKSEDGVVVYLDTFHDHQRAYAFFVNPLGVQADALWTEGQEGGDVTFDALWHAEARLTEEGYVVWMAIPFRSLRFPHRRVQEWGVAFERLIRRNAEEAVWPYITQRVASFAAQYATLEGIEDISAEADVDVVPYTAASSSRVLDRSGSGTAGWQADARVRTGFDTKVVLRNAFTLDAMLNPDFSQVESDTPQVTTNQRFEVFFPEKRPFFLENAGYFRTPTDLFFSRRVRDPLLGGRLTGRAGPWTLGAMLMDDRTTDSTGDSDAGRRALIGVARVLREFGDQSTLGVLATRREFGEASNDVGSLDARVRLGPNWVVTAQAMRSRTVSEAGQIRTGAGYWLDATRTGRHLAYAGRYSDLSPGFRTELGFVPRVDVRQVDQSFRYYWRPERGPVVAFGPDATLRLNWNREGRLQDRVVDVSFGADLRGPSGLGCSYVDAYELYGGVGFRHRFTSCGFNTASLGWLEVTGNYRWGSGINYAPAAGRAPSVGRRAEVEAGFTLRPSPGTRLGLVYLYTGLRARDGSERDGRTGGRVFDDHVLRTKLTYQLSRELSVRGILDYRATVPDTALVALEPSKRLVADLLVTYLVHPGTALYLGYSDTFENVETQPPWAYRSGGADVSTGRQLFAKLSYLMRF